MTARDKAMNTWSKEKGFKDQVSDEEESGKDEETSMASKVRKKRRRTSEALQFIQVKSEKEADARKEEISFKKEMAEKEAEARREDIAHKRAMASLEVKRQDLIQQHSGELRNGAKQIWRGVVCLSRDFTFRINI